MTQFGYRCHNKFQEMRHDAEIKKDIFIDEEDKTKFIDILAEKKSPKPIYDMYFVS